MNTTDTLTDDQIQNELLRPAYTFKGEELWPWSRSAKHCWQMICRSENDTLTFQVLAMMWILRKRQVQHRTKDGVVMTHARSAAEDLKANVIPRCFNDMDAVRAEIILWRDELTDEDEAAAFDIFNSTVNLEKATQVQVSSPSGTQKKITPTALASGDTTLLSSENTSTGRKTKRSLRPASPSKT